MKRVLGCLAVIAFADYVIVRHPPRWHAIALFDHPAHVATAILLGGTDRTYLAGSLLPDVDHIPMAFRSPMAGDPRPRTHSLLGPLAVAPFSPKLAAGMVAHLARDLALEPGVPLFGGRPYRLPVRLLGRVDAGGDGRIDVKAVRPCARPQDLRDLRGLLAT
jgi:hypothetical protein